MMYLKLGKKAHSAQIFYNHSYSCYTYFNAEFEMYVEIGTIPILIPNLNSVSRSVSYRFKYRFEFGIEIGIVPI